MRRAAAASPATTTRVGGGASRFSSLDNGSDAENAMHAALAKHLAAVHVKVTDVSGGCGSMFDIEVASPQFVGQTRVKQHRMVNEVRLFLLSGICVCVAVVVVVVYCAQCVDLQICAFLQILKEEIKGMHGLTIRTMTPEQFANRP